ncbi:sensor domain-containing phosphodiesterase [Aurantimonas sp. 22II-16-19i]|uniref:putative bifunctional diguanylate cyclase/phosphodiesterase n=1 Tax=Aurantimonas sp. 22II-16-19i TaxID=1317114 RepID=UPI0009F7FA36|nr:sensor domain-containing phosphodiesterase [Aurantimonas sp. 22II-16-19i]ORE91652.1 signal transduction protein [Aurantimonas sp. 22II-16-19i]
MDQPTREEAARLREVERYRRSSALTGEKLERIVKLASAMFGFERVNVTTHYADTQLCHVQLGELSAPRRREETVCRVPVETGELLVVEDLSQDPRFMHLPAVREEPHIRFYAGAPLVTPSGHAIGALCLLDTKPRPFTRHQGELLADLAALAVEHMELIAINEEAKYDTLTGLRNRPFLIDAMQASIDAGRASSILLIDLDGFKEINDSLGHACGDEALVQAAGRIAELCDGQRVSARLGGDEFVIFMDGEANPIEATKVAERAVLRLAEPMTIRGHVVQFGASIGIAIRERESDATQLLGNADLAMYRAKQDGRNCHRIFTRELRNVALERGNIVLEMQEAWEDGSFELYYQPIVRLSDGRWTGAEALLRWNYPYRGVLPPAMFLPVLEKSHLAVEIGTWVIDEACRQAAIWRRRFDPDFTIAVNLFELQFKPGTLVAKVRESLGRHGLPPEALQLELTERIILAEDSRIVDQVRALRDHGVGIAFDDFGIGLASLSALRHYPVSCIKIDRSFIAEVAGNAADQSIVASLIALSKSLKLETVAEGIETAEQRAMLEQVDGVNGQGFLFSRPQPVALLESVWSFPADKLAGQQRA